ncbi:MAG: DUF883 family protein [Opitutaceae bacterium]|nr:DUF883 family protein [Opitutaceae bacterium]
MKINEKSTTPSELLNDLQALVGEAEAMITDSVSEHSADAIESLQTRFHAAQARFAEAYAGARKKVVAGAKCTDTAIRENPYQALAIAGGIGLLLGVLLGRRSK